MYWLFVRLTLSVGPHPKGFRLGVQGMTTCCKQCVGCGSGNVLANDLVA